MFKRRRSSISTQGSLFVDSSPRKASLSNSRRELNEKHSQLHELSVLFDDTDHKLSHKTHEVRSLRSKAGVRDREYHRAQKLIQRLHEQKENLGRQVDAQRDYAAKLEERVGDQSPSWLLARIATLEAALDEKKREEELHRKMLEAQEKAVELERRNARILYAALEEKMDEMGMPRGRELEKSLLYRLACAKEDNRALEEEAVGCREAVRAMDKRVAAMQGQVEKAEERRLELEQRNVEVEAEREQGGNALEAVKSERDILVEFAHTEKEKGEALVRELAAVREEAAFQQTELEAVLAATEEARDTAIAALETERDAALASLEEVRSKYRQLQTLQADLQIDLRKERTKRSVAEDKIQRLEDLVALMQSRLKDTEGSELLSDGARTMVDRVAELEETVARLEDALRAEKDSVDALRRANADAEDAAARVRTEAGETRTQREELARENRDLQEAKAALEKTIAALQAQAKRSEAERETFIKKLEEAGVRDVELSTTLAENARLREHADQAAVSRSLLQQTLYGQVSELREELKLLREQHEEATKTRDELAEEKERLQMLAGAEHAVNVEYVSLLGGTGARVFVPSPPRVNESWQGRQRTGTTPSKAGASEDASGGARKGDRTASEEAPQAGASLVSGAVKLGTGASALARLRARDGGGTGGPSSPGPARAEMSGAAASALASWRTQRGKGGDQG